jgi:hypothetical protein
MSEHKISGLCIISLPDFLKEDMAQLLINDQKFTCSPERIGAKFFPRVQPELHIPMSKVLAFLEFEQLSRSGYDSSGKAEIEMIRLLFSVS